MRLRDLGAVRFGLHAFLSSNTTDPAYYPALARLLFQTGRELMDESGMPRWPLSTCRAASAFLTGPISP